jgi:hypothetical protein
MSASNNRFALLADDYKPPKVSQPPKEKDPPRFPAEVPENSAEAACKRYDLHLVVYHRSRWDKRVTKEHFLKYRHIPRYDVPANPTDVTNPFYVEMIKTGRHAWTVQTEFLGKNDLDFGSTLPSEKGWEHPIWSFHRSGRTRTVLPFAVTTDKCGSLPQGTKLFIGGYHGGDFLEEDFAIYNDVTIVKPDGTIHVLQYPLSDFPPTDYHTATLMGQEIYLIGSVGYLGHRGTKAQVSVLDLKTLSIHTVETTGDDPGWIYKHEIVNDLTTDRQITIRIRVPATTELEDGCVPGRWSFHISELRWSALPLSDTDIADRDLYQENLAVHKYNSEHQNKISQEERKRSKAEHRRWKLEWRVKVPELVSGMEENLASFDAKEKELAKAEELWEDVLRKSNSKKGRGGEAAREKLVKIRELLDQIRALQEKTRKDVDQWRRCLRLGDSSSDSDSDRHSHSDSDSDSDFICM